MLHYDGAIPDPAPGDYVADAHLDDVATTQLAIDLEVKERSVPKTPLLVEPKPNSPNLFWFEGALCAPNTTLNSGAEFMKSGI